MISPYSMPYASGDGTKVVYDNTEIRFDPSKKAIALHAFATSGFDASGSIHIENPTDYFPHFYLEPKDSPSSIRLNTVTYDGEVLRLINSNGELKILASTDEIPSDTFSPKFLSVGQTSPQINIDGSGKEIVWNELIGQTSGFYYQNGSDITILRDGLYKINYDVTLRNTTSFRSLGTSKLYKDNVEVDGTTTYHYLRNSQQHSQTASCSTVRQLSSGNVLTVVAQLFSSDSTGTLLRTQPNGCRFNIEYLY